MQHYVHIGAKLTYHLWGQKSLGLIITCIIFLWLGLVSDHMTPSVIPFWNPHQILCISAEKRYLFNICRIKKNDFALQEKTLATIYQNKTELSSSRSHSRSHSRSGQGQSQGQDMVWSGLTLTPTPTQKWDLSYTLKLVFTTHPPPTTPSLNEC